MIRRLGADAGVDARQLPARFIGRQVVQIFDDLILEHISDSGPWNVEVRGLEHLERARAAARGVTIVSGHFFANRWAKRYLGSIGLSMMSVRYGAAMSLRSGHFGQKYVRPRYGRFLHRVICDEVESHTPEASLKILQRLRSGGMVNVHIDAPISRETMSIPFLNSTRFFPTGFLKLVWMAGSAVVPMLCTGDSRRSVVRFDPPIQLTTSGDFEAFVSTTMPALAAWLEEQVRCRPEEWELWSITG
jgi:lauroyl/myristoyl acyltransferase